MKKIISLLLALVLVFSLVACGNDNETDKETVAETEAPTTEAETEAPATEAETEAEAPETGGGSQTGAINVVSREDGSGTRGAFVEIVGVLQDKNDLTVQTAAMLGSNGQVIETVAPDDKAIGYASLGVVEGNSNVKTLKVNGVQPTPETVASGEYPIQRPLNIAYKEDSLSDLAKDFISYVMSKEGQDLAVEEGFVKVDKDAKAYEGKDLEGTLNISGSTSVGPLIKKIAEAYKGIHSGVEINVNEHGSSAGMKDAMEGLVDIGMASRELKDKEAAELQHTSIAKDGIAMIVSPNNPVEEITMDSIKAIYIGEVTDWADVK